jgi:di/tricarboxylate transporter
VTVEKVLVVLGAFVAAAYVIIGIIGGLWASHWEEASTSDRVIWTVLLVGGGILLFLGLRMSRRSPWLGAALISVGAVAGALPIFWTILALVLAIALVVLSIMHARRAAGASPATS